jgi:Fe-S-cluster-containing dehydrogenase component
MAEPIYWRSLDELLRGGEASLEPAPASEPASEPLGRVSRRGFLQVLGASSALVGLEACSAPRGKALPYTRPPEGLVPSQALHYATAVTIGGVASPLLATTYEGRPVKIDGNPEHPASRGATGPIEQALLLQLYDPNRVRGVRHGREAASRPRLHQVLAETAARLGPSGGKGLHLLLEPDGSPLLEHLLSRLQKRFPAARIHYYSPRARDAAAEGLELALGRALETEIDLERADVICALDDDFLGRFPEATWLTRQFAGRRDPAEPGGRAMNRLYVAETHLSVTGMMADHRLRLRTAEMARLGAMLLLAVARTGDAVAQALAARLAPAMERLVLPGGRSQEFVSALARDLRRAAAGGGGRCVVLAGPRQPPLVHALAQAINSLLGVRAPVLRLRPAPIAAGPADLRELCTEMAAGRVDTLLIQAWNPVYSTPSDLDFAALLGRVPNSFYLSFYEDETARRVTWHIPAAHPFESWGDARAQAGPGPGAGEDTILLVQPLIESLFGGFTTAELLAAMTEERQPAGTANAALLPLPSDRQLLTEFWRGRAQGLSDADFERFWERALQQGFIAPGALGPAPGDGPPRKTVAPETLAVRWDEVVRALERHARQPDPGGGAEGKGLELNFYPDPKLLDGRYANNPWLQELPDPVTKLTWGNAALLSKKTADRLRIESGDVIELAAEAARLRVPALIVPGHADEAISLAVGYGRAGGEVNARGVGANANVLRTAAHWWTRPGVEVTRTGERQSLALTQEHWRMEGRPLALTIGHEDLGELDRSEDGRRILEQRGPLPSLYPQVEYPDHRWAMAIDLSRCTGCSACVVACQSENNIPAVGAEGVRRSREMHWLRIDRYFVGAHPDEPEAITQPVACVHCENAPCEYVCPVNATVHSDEGLNEMVYNRCVGTRFCSNNCPYKVRRFNYFNYTGHKTELEGLLLNPDVTVRARGVMEKCTYCVQRIERARIEARVAGRELKDGDIRTACQVVCPGDAIVFGDLNLKTSQVAAHHADPRRYDLLHELNTRPRTAYLARVKNPNPELAAESGPRPGPASGPGQGQRHGGG